VLLFLIIFVWTPPHFWALSLTRVDDYARARVPMLPVVAGLSQTRQQILIYSVLLIPVGAAPWMLGYAGAVYGVTAVAAGFAMVALAWHLRAEHGGKVAERAAGRMFAFSILYLFALFAVLLVERGMGGLLGRAAA
jgi:heme o synthase